MKAGTILTASDLRGVAISENNTPLVALQQQAPFLAVKYKKLDMLPYTGDLMYVRAPLLQKLETASTRLRSERPRHRLLVRYGYRHPEVQQRYFATRLKAHQAAYPTLNRAQLIELTHTQVAVPEVAGHPTGGAIDLTIIDGEGRELPMGTGIADYSVPERCYTFADGLCPEERKNRALLHDLMTEVGFAPFYAEWWHFSYGDREWACFYNHPTSLYAPIAFCTCL